MACKLNEDINHTLKWIRKAVKKLINNNVAFETKAGFAHIFCRKSLSAIVNKIAFPLFYRFVKNNFLKRVTEYLIDEWKFQAFKHETHFFSILTRRIFVAQIIAFILKTVLRCFIFWYFGWHINFANFFNYVVLIYLIFYYE